MIEVPLPPIFREGIIVRDAITTVQRILSLSASLYRRSIDVKRDGVMAYGRIEAFDRDHTMGLIQRTRNAEKMGLQGNIVSTSLRGFSLGRELTASFDPRCTDYIALFDPGIPESNLWPHAICRVGVSPHPIPNASPRQYRIPGRSGSPIPIAYDVGFHIGNSLIATRELSQLRNIAELETWG